VCVYICVVLCCPVNEIPPLKQAFEQQQHQQRKKTYIDRKDKSDYLREGVGVKTDAHTHLYMYMFVCV